MPPSPNHNQNNKISLPQKCPKVISPSSIIAFSLPYLHLLSLPKPKQSELFLSWGYPLSCGLVRWNEGRVWEVGNDAHWGRGRMRFESGILVLPGYKTPSHPPIHFFNSITRQHHSDRERSKTLQSSQSSRLRPLINARNSSYYPILLLMIGCIIRRVSEGTRDWARGMIDGRPNTISPFLCASLMGYWQRRLIYIKSLHFNSLYICHSYCSLPVVQNLQPPPIHTYIPSHNQTIKPLR